VHNIINSEYEDEEVIEDNIQEAMDEKMQHEEENEKKQLKMEEMLQNLARWKSTKYFKKVTNQ
jgi:hypothetical protein